MATSTMRPEDFRLFLPHLMAARGGLGPMTCPVCSTQEWSVGGPIGAPVYQDTPEGPGSLGPGAMLFVTMSCVKCFHTMLFQWLPIQKAASNG
jgi:hypothetical protein